MLTVLGDELGVEFAIAELTAALGPPLHHVFADYLPGEQIPAAVDRFRALYPSLAIEPVSLLPGAAEAIAAVRRHGGRVVVVTGKHGPNAQLHLDHLGVDLDHLGGGVWGVGKADVLRAEGVSIYVGDHVHDVAGARGADALSVSVLTGGSSEAELRAPAPTSSSTRSRSSPPGSTSIWAEAGRPVAVRAAGLPPMRKSGEAGAGRRRRRQGRARPRRLSEPVGAEPGESAVPQPIGWRPASAPA